MGIPSKAQLSSAFQSKDSFLEFIRVPDAPAGQTTVGKGRWSNRDLEPTPMEERTWKW
jgi:NCS1 family nucleobase:cation symporter-1